MKLQILKYFHIENIYLTVVFKGSDCIDSDFNALSAL